MSEQCQKATMEGNHRNMDNAHRVMVIVNNGCDLPRFD